MLCEECELQPAVRFCLCRFPYYKFCDGCDLAHYQRAPRMTHFKHPVAECQAVLSGQEPVATFRTKQAFISDLEYQLEQDICEFDAFARQVERELTTLVKEVIEKKEAVLKDLAIQRPKLVSVVEEARRIIAAKRYLGTFEVNTYLDDCIHNGYKNAILKEVRVFKGKINSQEMLEKLVEYEVSTSLLQEIIQDIPVIKGQYVRLFNRLNLSMTQMILSQNTKIDRTSGYCYIDKETILACGGCTHAEVYIINVRTGQVTIGPNMKFARRWVGLYNFNQYVYVFGGYNSDNIDSVERFSLATKSWTNPPPPPMQIGKYCCTIAEHSTGLYISGYYAHRGTSVEYYNPVNETFRLLRDDTVTITAILFCVGDELIHIRGESIETADVSSGPANAVLTVKAKFTQIANGHCWLNCPAALFRGEYMSALNNWDSPIGLFKLNPAKYQFAKVADFTY